MACAKFGEDFGGFEGGEHCAAHQKIVDAIALVGIAEVSIIGSGLLLRVEMAECVD